MTKESPYLHSALLIMGSRLVSMSVGIFSIPLLLNFLGLEQFAAWAILLGGSAAFFSLELGMTDTVVKFMSQSEEEGGGGHSDAVLTNAMLILTGMFLLGFLVICGVAEPVGLWLNLPDTLWFDRADMILFVFTMVALCSFQKTLVNTLYVIQRFDMMALINLLNSALPNLMAVLAAWITRRLDVVLVTFWSSQLLVLMVAGLWVRSKTPWRVRLGQMTFLGLRRMFAHGLNIQFSDFAHVIHFQFDKWIIAGLVKLSEVAHYEVASRAGMALRSVTSSGLGTLLPAVTRKVSRGENIWLLYLETTRAALHLTVLFVLLPMAISPLFLFAWVGQIGYHGRWVFCFLSLGIAMNVIALPVCLFLQAMGRTKIEARAAAISIVLNIGLSLLFVQNWEKEGAAAGTGLSMVLMGLGILYYFHRLHGKSLRHTLYECRGQLLAFIPVGLFTILLMDVVTPLVIHSRKLMAPAAVGIYACSLLMLLLSSLLLKVVTVVQLRSFVDEIFKAFRR
jgi:O-antigen/teichoic acid export membrane protein